MEKPDVERKKKQVFIGCLLKQSCVRSFDNEMNINILSKRKQKKWE